MEHEAVRRLSGVSRATTAIILGTGLGIMERDIEIRESITYADIPGFPVSSVSSHSGRLIAGTLGGHEVLVMSGRFHLYEGYQPREVTFPVRVFARLGIRRLFISNAAGGLRPDLIPGSCMLISDHINATARNPLTGPNDEDLGPRFTDMTAPYAPGLLELARAAARYQDIDLHEGVYVQVPGPAMETAAETRMFMRLGADAVGMSTVMEVIQAVHAGLEVLAISAITNNNDPDDYRPAPLEEVISQANIAGPSIARIFQGVLAGLPD